MPPGDELFKTLQRSHAENQRLCQVLKALIEADERGEPRDLPSYLETLRQARETLMNATNLSTFLKG